MAIEFGIMAAGPKRGSGAEFRDGPFARLRTRRSSRSLPGRRQIAKHELASVLLGELGGRACQHSRYH